MAEETSWTEERLEKLKTLWDSGLSISQIGEQLGVTRKRLPATHRLKLPKRQSPISKLNASRNSRTNSAIYRCVWCCAISNGRGPNASGRRETRKPLSLISAVHRLCRQALLC